MRKLLIKLFNLPSTAGEGSEEGFKEILIKVCLEPRMVGLIIVSFSIFFGGLFFYIQPRVSEVAVLDRTLFLKQQELAQKQKLLKTIQKSWVEIADLPVSLGETNKKDLLEKEAQKQVNRLLNTLKDNNKLSLHHTDLKAKPSITEAIPPLSFSNPMAHAQNGTLKNPQSLNTFNLSRHSFELTFTGSYIAFAHVLNQVAQSKTLMVIDDLLITPAKKIDSGEANSKPLTMALTLSIYFPLSLKP